MPELSLPDISALDAAQLEQRRRNIIEQYTGKSSLDDMSVEHLHELCAITSALRRKTATAPKSAKKSASPRTKKVAKTTEDIFNQL